MPKKRIRATVLSTAAATMLLATACGTSLTDDEASDDASNGEWPETIVYGVLPTDDTEKLLATYTPLETYMETCLDHPFELFTGTDYTAMIEAMRTGNLHISKFGAFSYILAEERAGAEALVTPVREDLSTTYTSVFITLESHGLESVTDLEGESFAFVDAASTSGHLFPRAKMVDDAGIANDELETWLGEAVFSGGHDASLLSVLNGDVTAAAISSNLWLGVEDGEWDDHENIDDLVMLDETQDIPRTTEAIQGDLPDDLKEAVATCYEDAIDAPEMSDYFADIAPGGYLPIDDTAFDVVRETASALDMSPEDLLAD